MTIQIPRPSTESPSFDVLRHFPSRAEPLTSGPHLFAPALGAESRTLWKLVAAAAAGELLPTVEEYLASAELPEDMDRRRLLFALSLLRDILRAGGNVMIRDSRLFVSWPNWEGTEGRKRAKRALIAAREMRPLSREEIQRVAPLFAPDMDGEQLCKVLAEAEFSLASANATHPSGVSYQEAFSAALRYWTMPYRGRSGRMKRFVLIARHEVLGEWPVVAGILEFGDEAPFCTWRDEVLGLNAASFCRWLATDSQRLAQEVRDRLASIRRCLRATTSGIDLSHMNATDVLARREAIERAAHGRSRVRSDQQDLLKDRKRLAYGLRLARGEAAMSRIVAGVRIDERDPDLLAGVRGFHDLVLPRLHLEATICGAVPPFAQVLCGKLVVAFFCHPDVVDSSRNATSELLNWSFHPEALRDLLPNHGLLCLTTKGLYANHAALYNRADSPGALKPLRLRHLANTLGHTTSLISDFTARCARHLLESPDSESARVSNLYGSGGAKRHRAIEKAAIEVGLPVKLVMAGITRPVYGLMLVSNPEAVSWLGEAPQWLIDRGETASQFSARATELWRSRWLNKAMERAREYALVPSLTRQLLRGDHTSPEE